MPDDLCAQDAVEWSERQFALLRRLAADERVNDLDLDWPHIVEEIADAATRTVLRDAVRTDTPGMRQVIGPAGLLARPADIDALLARLRTASALPQS